MIWGRGPVQVSRLTYTLRGPEWGFAVPQGNLAALEEVIRLCSSFWNGLGSLIIPVRSDGTLDQSLDRLLEVREVDQVLVHDAVGERAREALGKRFREVGSLWMDDHEIHPYYLSLNDRDESLASIQRPVFGSRRLRRVAEATWGHIADDEVEDWRRRFEVTEETRRTEALRGILKAQIRGNSPLLLGARHMGAYEQRAGFDGYPCLFVFGRAGFEEIVHFWNLRSRLSGFHDSRPIVGISREMLSATELRADPRLGRGTEGADVLQTRHQPRGRARGETRGPCGARGAGLRLGRRANPLPPWFSRATGRAYGP